MCVNISYVLIQNPELTIDSVFKRMPATNQITIRLPKTTIIGCGQN